MSDVPESENEHSKSTEPILIRDEGKSHVISLISICVGAFRASTTPSQWLPGCSPSPLPSPPLILHLQILLSLPGRPRGASSPISLLPLVDLSFPTRSTALDTVPTKLKSTEFLNHILNDDKLCGYDAVAIIDQPNVYSFTAEVW